MPSKNQFTYPLAPAVREALEAYLIDKRADETSADIGCTSTGEELASIHRIGREGVRAMSDLRLQHAIAVPDDDEASTTVKGVGKVPEPDWARIGTRCEDVFWSRESLFLSIARNPSVLLRVFSARHHRWLSIAGQDLVGMPDSRLEPILRVGVALAA